MSQLWKDCTNLPGAPVIVGASAAKNELEGGGLQRRFLRESTASSLGINDVVRNWLRKSLRASQPGVVTAERRPDAVEVDVGPAAMMVSQYVRGWS